MSRWIIILFVCLQSLNIEGQVLFLEDCFVGGVQTGGQSTLGELIDGAYNIHWDEDFTIRRAYALTYRYGRPDPHTIFLNKGGITWSLDNQAGPEQLEENILTDYFATHAVDITDFLVIDGEFVNVDLPLQPFDGNKGWWSVYVVLLYESPDINTSICTRIYLADQTQDDPQNYTFGTPSFNTNNPLLFSIHSHRLSSFFDLDATTIMINSEFLGNIWGPDLLLPAPVGGVQGHFFYENGIAEGLNGDTANTQVIEHDGIADIREYLTEDLVQELDLIPVAWPDDFFANPHPAFMLTYTPECEVIADDMDRQYTLCRGDSVQFQAIVGYENYSWSTSEFLNDSTLANPWCTADSSRWYTVRMWNEDESLCPQTIPVHIEVRQTPRARNVFTRSSSCPQPTGEIRFEEMSGTPPFLYTVNNTSQDNPAFTPLDPGTYTISVEDDFGCSWDSTATLIYNPSHEAAFTANPDSGYTPLSVFFDNGSSINSTGFIWLINGEFITSNENLAYVFEEPGVYEVMLIATRLEETCTDTATATIIVNQGLEMIIPNIITPNGDGQNDRLVAQVFGAASLRWTIFDRWGIELFSGETSTIEESLVLWEPTDAVKDGQYFLVVVGTSEDGKRQEVKATVTVLR